MRKGEFAKGFYLIESGEVVLESGEESGEPVVVEHDWSGGFAWLVVDVPAIRVAFHRVRGRTTLTPSFSTGQLCGNIARKDHSLGYELLKRTSPGYAQAFAGDARKDALHRCTRELDVDENEGKR